MHPHVRAATIALSITALLSVGLSTAAPTSVSAAPERAGAAVGPTLKPPKITGKACRGEAGVTVVVDFRTLLDAKGKKMNRIKIGCAQGAQESGFTALLDAGFEVDPDSPFVCTIDDRPIDPPGCPAPNGFWSYSHGERGEDWVLSGVGAGGWQPPRGSLEGWSWAPYDKVGWEFPRVSPSDLFPPLG